MDSNNAWPIDNMPSLNSRVYLLGKLQKIVSSGYMDERLKKNDSREKYLFSLEPQLSQKMIKVSGGSDVTLYIVLLSAFIGFLHRYTGRENLAVSIPVYNREHKNSNDTLPNELIPIFQSIEEGSCFKDLLIELKQQFVHAVEHQDYPISNIWEILNIKSDQGNALLKNLVFASANIHDLNSVLSLKDYRILVVCNRDGERIDVSVHFSSSLYSLSDISDMVKYGLFFINEVLDDMSTALTCMRLMSNDSATALLELVHNAPMAPPITQTLVQRFEDQAARSPEGVAIVYNDYQMTYKELNARANFLAKLLVQKGVQRESPVALLFERGVEQIVSIIGVLKAGGAYIPIDPGSPIERSAFMLNESCPVAIVTTADIALRHSISNDAILLEPMVSSKEWQQLAPQDKETLYSNPIHLNDPKDLAYLMFTSGSTGTPKAAMIEHVNVVNLVSGLQQEVYNRYEEGLRVALLAPYFFDASVQQIFAALLLGHSLYIVPEDVRVDGKRLLEFYIKHQIDISDGTPNHVLLLLGANQQQLNQMTVRHFLIGGEALALQTLEHFYSMFQGDAPIITNVYGLTECSVDSLYFHVMKNNLNDYKRIPIGKPLPYESVYIVNKEMQLQPVGVVGEICIGGMGVGRGYLNKLEKHAQSFISDSHFNEKRLFKTGDLARWLPDGNVEYIGRIDDQVKIRGYRIELGEIEHVLRKHPSIDAVKVITVNMDQGVQVRSSYSESASRELCAYIAIKQAVKITALREFLAEYLPDYMIPSYFIKLDALPVTSNGKVSIGNLPELDMSYYEEDEDQVAPGNEIETELLECWKQVLARQSISVHDNFFKIGGDSIKAIQVVSRIRQRNYSIEVRDIFRFPTISDMANHVSTRKRIPVQETITGCVPLTPIQQDFFESSNADVHHYNQSLLLDVDMQFNEAALTFIVMNLQKHHDALRLVFSSERRVLFHRGTEIKPSIQYQDLRHSENESEQLQQWIKRIQSSIDLEQGPLLQAGLFKMKSGKKLFIAIHHLVVDGISWRILLEDIETLYMQYKEGKPATLPLKSDSFKLWAEQLGNYAQNEHMYREIDYWREIEAKLIGIPPLKRDLSPLNFVGDGETITFSLNESDTELLLIKSHQAFNTEINDMLLTALGRGFGVAFDAPVIAIELEGHGREPIIPDLDHSRTVGWFTSWYPVIVDASSNHPTQSLKQVKEMVRSIPNKGIGYLIAKYLRKSKDMDFERRPQICFNYLGQFDEDLKNVHFSISNESVLGNESDARIRVHDFHFSGAVLDRKLHMTLQYSKKQYNQKTVERLMDAYYQELLQLIKLCTNKDSSEVTPSDLGYKHLTMEELDGFFE